MIIVWGIAIFALVLFFISSIKKGQSILGMNKFLASQSINDLYSTFTIDSDKLEDVRVSLISEFLEIEKAEDDKIIRILRHYFKTSSTTHLYAMLKSYKVFLHIIKNDKQKPN